VATERVRRRFLRVGVGDPVAVHDEPVFIRAGWKQEFLGPAALAHANHLRRHAMPLVECARDADALRRGMDELEMHQHRAGSGRWFGSFLFCHRLFLVVSLNRICSGRSVRSCQQLHQFRGMPSGTRLPVARLKEACAT